MGAYSKQQQNMDFKWQLARKIDRLDLGTFAALEFFYRNTIIFGVVRAMDPAEKEEDQGKHSKSIDALMQSVDTRIKDLMGYDTTALLMGKLQLPEVQEFQKKTVSCWYEVAEITNRCKLTDNVRAPGEELP
jgi:hypothetical protein